jgi:hypothetical protein
MLRRLMWLPAAASLTMPAGAAAQCPPGQACPPETPRWVGDFAALSANVFLGGITAGVARHLDGGSFRDGFVDGLTGGAAVWAGKRVAAGRFDGAGLLGREIGAAGVSMVRNAGFGRSLFHTLVLPLGPLQVEWTTTTNALNARVDPIALGWIAYGVAENELHFDFGGTLSAGAPVFRTRDRILRFGDEGVHAAGVTSAGVIIVADVPGYGDAFTRRALAHERVHVLQQDHIAEWWVLPLTRNLLERVPFARHASPHVAVNLSTELLRGLGHLFSAHAERPWELEATFLARE